MTTPDTARLERLTAALADIDEFVALRLPRLDAPGVAVGLTDRERTLGFVCRGSADVASGTPVEPDTRFQIGSISKSFAAAVMLQEHDAGRVDLRAPVTDYVPWFTVRSRFGPITLHHLLSHTSGLIMGTEFTAEARGAVWALRETDTGSAPGERFWYSNDGYKLVGLALEAVTGRPVHELVAERIVAPLGMAATETTIRRDSDLPVATGYERRGDDRPAHAGRPLDVAALVESCSADGSIVSSAADMLDYARLILNRGDAPGGRLLSEAAFERWSAPEDRGPRRARLVLRLRPGDAHDRRPCLHRPLRRHGRVQLAARDRDRDRPRRDRLAERQRRPHGDRHLCPGGAAGGACGGARAPASAARRPCRHRGRGRRLRGGVCAGRGRSTRRRGRRPAPGRR